MVKVIVIGLGSMGKRRLRILSEKPNLEIFGVDSNKERCAAVNKEFGIQCYNSLDEAFGSQKIDCAFVSTSPLSHATIINQCLKQGAHVFTELNLVKDGYEENMKLAEEKGLVLFLSSTSLYKKEIKAIKERINKSESKLDYIYHIGQYLPDWHPWESYKDYFIGDKRTNGCREILAIDLPFIVSCFGKIKNWNVLKSRNTSLNIDYNDNFMMLFEHEGGAKGTVTIDVVCRKAVRKMEVFGEDLYVSWDGTPDSLKEYDIENKEEKVIPLENASEHVEGYASFITENPYRDEVNEFFEQINNRSFKPAWSFEKDLEILHLIDELEK